MCCRDRYGFEGFTGERGTRFWKQTRRWRSGRYGENRPGTGNFRLTDRREYRQKAGIPFDPWEEKHIRQPWRCPGDRQGRKQRICGKTVVLNIAYDHILSDASIAQGGHHEQQSRRAAPAERRRGGGRINHHCRRDRRCCGMAPGRYRLWGKRQRQRQRRPKRG